VRCQQRTSITALFSDEEEVVKAGQMHVLKYLHIFTNKIAECFLDKWREVNPTIATGWNIDGFDFPYLHARLLKVFDEETAGKLSPIGVCYFNKFKNKMTIAGVNTLDYLLLYKKYSQKNLRTIVLILSREKN
jgi:DNA polymerase elongation subunit (family B)